jgi:hypothetical protein
VAPTLALVATRFCSACSMSGRLSSSADGKSAGMAGARSCPIVLPCAIGPGLRPSKMEIAFFKCGDLLVDGRNRDLGKLILGARFAQFGFRYQTRIVAQRKDGLAEICGRCDRDFALFVQAAQRDRASGLVVRTVAYSGVGLAITLNGIRARLPHVQSGDVGLAMIPLEEEGGIAGGRLLERVDAFARR